MSKNKKSQVTAPAGWSEIAVDIVESRYMRKKGVPKTDSETSVEQLVDRVLDSLVKRGKTLGYLGDDRLGKALRELVLNQAGSFNSPVWFNLGLWDQYQIKGAPGNYVWDADEGVPREIENGYEFPQCSACFIQSVGDDLMEIFELVKSEARIFKFGSGTGTNFSNLRGKLESLSGGGKSSGLIAFLEVLDKGAGATKSGGTTRRAAKMVCVDVDHPDILEFIQWKSKEEAKAKALIKAGYDSSMDGEAYRSVSGQNSNNSIRVSDDFMSALSKNKVWRTRFRGEDTDSAVEAPSYTAGTIWDEIAKSAWECSDPGLQFHDNTNRWHTCPNSGPIRASNPCSEYLFLDDSACNLASLNLAKFLSDDGFQTEDFVKACQDFILAQEILVEVSSYPTAKIATNAHRFRPLGLGYSNLGSALILQGLAYNSEEGRDWAGAVTALMSGAAFLQSARLAEKHGAFGGYEENRENYLRVFDQHAEALETLSYKATLSVQTKVILTEATNLWNEAFNLGRKAGFRNAQLTVLAPTGTISLMMDCDTTGVEPEFAFFKKKTLFEGKEVDMPNRSLRKGLLNMGLKEPQVDEVERHIQSHGTVEGAPHLNKKQIDVFLTANEISPESHLEMMAAIQPFLSGGISKTVGLPRSATPEDIKKTYELAWKLGLKSISIYRDGSKESQPLKACDPEMGCD